MRAEKEILADEVRDDVHAQPARGRYEPPRVEKGRRLTEVTGQAAAVPSGAPVPPKPPKPEG